MKKLLFLGLLLKSFLLWAQTTEIVTLQELSSRQRSMTIDKGLLDGFDEGNLAKFYLQRGEAAYPKLYLAAEAELVKSFPRKSYWLIKKIHIPKAMVEGREFLILNSKSVTTGRPLKVKTKKIVVSNKDYQSLENYEEKNKSGVPNRLIKIQNKFEKGDDLFFDIQKNQEADVVVTEFAPLKKKSGTKLSDEYGTITEEKYFDQNTNIDFDEIKDVENKKLFESMSEGYLAQANRMKYGVKGFYKDQEKIKASPDVSNKTSIRSVYDDVRENEKIADQVSQRAEAKYQRDGNLWSAEMDDAQLRRYFIETGLQRELRRRELALNELDGNELILHFSNALTDHTTAEDSNYRSRAYNIGISYDLHLSRTTSELKNWSIQFLYDQGISNYNVGGGFNAKATETSYGAYLNYYFIHNPTTLNAFIFLAGAGIKNGAAKITSAALDGEYSYQALTLPALQLMTKYRFRSGDLKEDSVQIGTSLNFGVNFDMKNLSTKDELSDSIDSKFSVSELRYTVGMSVYF